MPACIDLMAETLATTARGGALLPLRDVVMLPGGHVRRRGLLCGRRTAARTASSA